MEKIPQHLGLPWPDPLKHYKCKHRFYSLKIRHIIPHVSLCIKKAVNHSENEENVSKPPFFGVRAAPFVLTLGSWSWIFKYNKTKAEMKTAWPHYACLKPFIFHGMPTGWAFEMFTKLCSFHSAMFRYHIPCKSACMRQSNWYHVLGVQMRTEITENTSLK